MDEEKRARLSMLSHCGVDAWRPPDIPFGVRAIQNGIEVEGIWISRPNTPEKSQDASIVPPAANMTQAEGQSDISKGKERMVDIPPSPEGKAPASTSSDLYPGPQGSLRNTMASSSSNSANLHDINSGGEIRNKQPGSDSCHGSSFRNPFGTYSHTSASNLSKEPSTASSDADPLSESAFYRNAEIVINRNTRRHRQCAVVPSGTWRGSTRHSSDGIGARSNERQHQSGESSGTNASAAMLRKLPTNRDEKVRSHSLDSGRI